MDWKKTLSTVAPLIATALGTPVAGLAVSAAVQSLGLSENTVEALEQAVMGGNPETLMKLKGAESAFKVEMKRLNIDVMKLDTADRDSARLLAKDKGIWLQAGLTVLFVVLFSLLLYLIFSGEEVVHSSMRDIANFLLGTLTGILIQQMNFWFGSSEGSKRKSLQMGVLK